MENNENNENKESKKSKKSKENKENKSASPKKVQANRKNSERSTGPKTEVGKLRARKNALKHGIFASELKVGDEETPEFVLVKRGLDKQLAPASILLQIAFERVLCAVWGWKRAQRFMTQQSTAHLELPQRQELPDNAPSDNVLPTDWNGASKADLNAVLRFLHHLRLEVEANGWIHAEQWKDPITRLLGPRYYELLTHWIPTDISVIQVASHLSAHAKNFDMPLPSQVLNDGIVVDPKLSWQMGLKLIDLVRQQVEDATKAGKVGAGGADQQQGAAALDLAVRYLTTATRELERAVDWYQDLAAQGL